MFWLIFIVPSPFWPAINWTNQIYLRLWLQDYYFFPHSLLFAYRICFHSCTHSQKRCIAARINACNAWINQRYHITVACRSVQLDLLDRLCWRQCELRRCDELYDKIAKNSIISTLENIEHRFFKITSFYRTNEPQRCDQHESKKSKSSQQLSNELSDFE